MNKTLLNFARLAFSAAFVIAPFAISAQDAEDGSEDGPLEFQVDGISYRISDPEDGENVIVIPSLEGVKYVGDIVVPVNVEYEGKSYTVTSVDADAFSESPELLSLELPESITSLPDYALYRCGLLQRVALPETLSDLGDYTFWGCSSLSDFKVPSEVLSIGTQTFYGCEALELINLSGVTNIGDRAFSGCSGLTSLTFGEYLSSVGQGAFRNCTSLTSVNLGDCEVQLSPNLFEGCSRLVEVVLPPSVAEIPAYCFYGCSRLETVAFPESTVSVGSYAFANCGALKEVAFPSTLAEICEGAFRESGLEYFDLKGLDVRIGDNAFAHCPNLVQAFMEGATEIGASAFSGCRKLNRLALYDGLGSIGSLAFHECLMLNTIYMMSDYTPHITVSTFDKETYTQALLFVPVDCVQLYHQTAYWGNFSTIAESKNLPTWSETPTIPLSKFVDIAGGVLTIGNADCPVGVYTVDGRTLYSGVAGERTQISLPEGHGIVILATPGETLKLAY